MNCWDVYKIGELCDVITGSTPSRTNSEYWNEGSVPWFTVDDIRKGGRVIQNTIQHVTEKAVKESSLRLMPTDTVLLCCTASVGEYAITRVPITSNQQFNGLVIKSEFKDKLSADFLFNVASTLKEKLKAFCGKTSVDFVSGSNLKSIQIPLPPLAEQRKIAEILRTWDEAIEIAEAELKAKQEHKRGLMRNLLTPGVSGRGVDSVAILKRKMPKDWKMGRLGDLATGARGVSFTPEKLIQVEDADSVILLRSNNIKEGKLNFDEVYYLPKKEVQPSQIASPGDLAVCMSNGSKRLVGKAARITTEDAGKKICVGAFCSLFKPTDQACTDIIPYLFDSDFYKRELYIILAGSAINNLKNSDIENVPALIPPLDIQRNITKILMSVDDEIEIINHRIDALRSQKRGLMQKLLTGEVRVAA